MVLGDSREGLPDGREVEDEEEKLLKQAIALSLEGAEENDNEEEEELLRQAIALDLEGLEEEDDQEESS